MMILPLAKVPFIMSVVMVLWMFVALALILILEVSYVLSYYTGVVEFIDMDIITLMRNVVAMGGIFGAAIGAAVGLLIGIAFTAFPAPRRIRLDD